MSTGQDLFDAVKGGDKKVVKNLLWIATSTDVNWVDTATGDSALLIASYNGSAMLVSMLLGHRSIDVNITDKHGRSALMWACCWGHTKIVELLLTKPRISLNLRDKGGCTALSKARDKGFRHIESMLLAHISLNESDVYRPPKAVSRATQIVARSPITLDREMSSAISFNDERAVPKLLSQATPEDVNRQDAGMNVKERPSFSTSEGSSPADTIASMSSISIITESFCASPTNNTANCGINSGFATPPLTPAAVITFDNTHSPRYAVTASGDSITTQVVAVQNGYEDTPAPDTIDATITTASPSMTTTGDSIMTPTVTVPNRTSIAENDDTTVRDTIDETIAISSPSTVAEPSILTPTSSSPHLSWLAVRLLERGIKLPLAMHCESKLVDQEGFVSENDFAGMPPSELDSAYLKDIGITGKGVQGIILRLHMDLHVRYLPTSPSPTPPPPLHAPLPPSLEESAKISIQPTQPEATSVFTCGTIPIEDILPVLSRSPYPPMSVEQLQECYSDQNQLFSCVALLESTSRYQLLLNSCMKLKPPQERITSNALYQRAASHPGWHRAQQENVFLKEKVSDKLDGLDKKLDKMLEAIQVGCDALGGEVVKMTDGLRQAIKQGHHGLLVSMEEATAVSLKQLCDAQNSTNSITVEHIKRILSCITNLQRRIDHDLVTVSSHGSTSSSINTEGFAKLLRGVLELHARFDNLSTQLQEQVQSGADSVRFRAEALEMNHALTASLQEALKGIAAVQSEGLLLKQGQEQLSVQVSRVLQDNQKLGMVLELMKARFDALGGEVVGMAEVLRREIIQGHDGMLISMKGATEDALRRLCDAQNATDSSSVEHINKILSCIHDLHNRIQDNVSLSVNRTNPCYSYTEGFEDRLLNVSKELHVRFDNLSSQLQEQVQQQSAAGADSALARAEALEMNRALTASLQEALKGIATIQSEVLLLKRGQEQLGVQVSRVLRDNKRLDTMLRTLIVGTHDIPTYAIILPVVAKTWSDRANPMRLVRNQFRLYFLCSHTHQIAPCGPKGEGYRINVTKEWVRDAAPVLMAALVMLKLALMAGGIPLPIPDLYHLLDSPQLHAEFLNATLHLIKDQVQSVDTGKPKDQELEMKKALDALENIAAEDMGFIHLEDGAPKAHAVIKSILSSNKIDISLSSGLRKVVHPKSGRSAWVLDDDSVVEEYRSSH